MYVIRASMQENLSLAFPKKWDSNQLLQLQRLAIIVKVCLLQVLIWYYPKTNNRGADQSAWCRLVCAFVVLKPRIHVFSRWVLYNKMVYVFVPVGSWFVSPLLSGGMSILLFFFINRVVLSKVSILTIHMDFCCLIWFLVPVNNFSVISGQVFLCWTVLSKDKCVFLNDTTVMPVRHETCGPSVSSQALYHWATVLPTYPHGCMFSGVFLNPGFRGILSEILNSCIIY